MPPAEDPGIHLPSVGLPHLLRGAAPVTDEPALNGAPHSLLVEADTGGRDFAIDASDAPNATDTDIDQLTDVLIPLVLKEVPGGTATTRTYTATSDGLLGRQFDVEKDGKPVLRIRDFAAGGRFYTLVAKSAFGVDDPAVDQFLYSFHVLPGAPATNATPAANAVGK